ncbi:MAG: hypothetical protein ACLUT1_02105 [Ruminococcus sp.]
MLVRQAFFSNKKEKTVKVFFENLGIMLIFCSRIDNGTMKCYNKYIKKTGTERTVFWQEKRSLKT